MALAKLVMDSRRISNQPSIVLPGNPEFVDDDELRTLAAGVVGDIVALVSRAKAIADSTMIG